ncbi:MAG: GNAT family N-acetyltransferase [Candidatus Paceibacterota bacterium]
MADNNQVQLKIFDKKYIKSIEGYTEILLKKDGIYYTIMVNRTRAGVVGYIPAKTYGRGFVQIVIEPKFRGKGILKIAEDMLAKKHELDRLYATIKKTNTRSIKAHLKAGFKKFSKRKLDLLRKEDLLKKEDIRLVKEYK